MGAAVFWFSFVNIFLQVAETVLRTITVKLYNLLRCALFILNLSNLWAFWAESLCVSALVGEFKSVAPTIQITTLVIPFYRLLKDITVAFMAGYYYCSSCNITVSSESQFIQHQASRKHKQVKIPYWENINFVTFIILSTYREVQCPRRGCRGTLV